MELRMLWQKKPETQKTNHHHHHHQNSNKKNKQNEVAESVRITKTESLQLNIPNILDVIKNYPTYEEPKNKIHFLSWERKNQASLTRK